MPRILDHAATGDMDCLAGGRIEGQHREGERQVLAVGREAMAPVGHVVRPDDPSEDRCPCRPTSTSMNPGSRR